MQQAGIHFQFNNFLTNFSEALENPAIESQDVELQIKYGFLAKNKNQTLYKSLVNSSRIRPIDLKQGKNKFNFKVNARCSPQEHTNARTILEQLVERADCQVQVRYLLYMNQGEEKYLYDCRYEQWMRIYKEQLVKYQSNFLFQNRLFRIDLSEKIKEDKHVLQKIKQMFQKRQKSTGVLRFKKINYYSVNQLYKIQSSIVFETGDEDWFSRMKKLIYQKGDNLAEDITAIIQQKVKEKYEIKHQLQLKFTQEGIATLRKGLNNQTKQIFSSAFDFVTEITLKQSRGEWEVIKIMKNLGLQEKKEEEPQKQESKSREESLTLKHKGALRKQEEKPVQDKKLSEKEEVQYIFKK